ncbi:6853_t:CDS:2 [Diversispora eburnea]|uniref:6853_t:CDS:1 n=1 Tax=Diversispora eburnea TaxID=1213867 RepID=A0A9N8V4U4_9GLOM|nr:6853_t:CDS:2 [Diversispora eburnea]
MVKSDALTHLTSGAMSEVIGKETIFGLWRGTIPTILRNVPGTSLYFFTLSEIRSFFSRRHQTTLISPGSSLPILSNKENLVAGAIARGSVGFIMMPITVVKVRYESNLYNYKSIWNALTTIVKCEGIKGLYYGYGATVIRDAPYAGTYLLFYEHRTSISAPIVHMTSAMIAGFSATTVTHPFDKLKTRIQLKPREYPNFFRGALKVLRDEGFWGFFDGLSLRLGRKVMQAAIGWTLYEELVTLFKRKKEET